MTPPWHMASKTWVLPGGVALFLLIKIHILVLSFEPRDTAPIGAELEDARAPSEAGGTTDARQAKAYGANNPLGQVPSIVVKRLPETVREYANSWEAYPFK